MTAPSFIEIARTLTCAAHTGARFPRAARAVPQSLGFCGFTDPETVAVTTPPITRIRTFREDIARRAIRMVLAGITGQPVDELAVDLGVDLIARKSSARTG